MKTNFLLFLLTIAFSTTSFSCTDISKRKSHKEEFHITDTSKFEIKFVGRYVTWVEEPPHSRHDFYYVYGFSGLERDYDSLLNFSKTLEFDSTKFQHTITFLKYDIILPDTAGNERFNYLFDFEKYFIFKFGFSGKTHRNSYAFWQNGKIVKVVNE